MERERSDRGHTMRKRLYVVLINLHVPHPIVLFFPDHSTPWTFVYEVSCKAPKADNKFAVSRSTPTLSPQSQFHIEGDPFEIPLTFLAIFSGIFLI